MCITYNITNASFTSKVESERIFYPLAAERAKRAEEVARNKNTARLSLLDMEIQQDKGGAHMASSVAWGYGPAIAMPTLVGMMGGTEESDMGPDGQQV